MEKTYTLTEIKSAFFAEFHESGERFFNYLGREKENRQSTETEWESFKACLGNVALLTWKDCDHYQEMYDLKHTWGSMKCNGQILSKPEDCSGCPLEKEISADEMIDYEEVS